MWLTDGLLVPLLEGGGELCTYLLAHVEPHSDYYRRKRSLGQGNIFTPVCHSVHRGGSASRHARLPTPPPPGSRPPRTRHPPQSRPSGTRHPPGTRHPLPGPDTPHGVEHAGQRVGSTYPTGMQSCTYVCIYVICGMWRNIPMCGTCRS